MATIATVLRKDKINKKGLAPIHFRITRHRKSRYISSSIYIEPKHWNKKKEIVKPSHPNSVQVNNHLSKKYSELQAEVLNLETTSKAITTPKLKEKILGANPKEFIPFAEKSLERYLSNGQIGTHDKNRSVVRKLKAYLGDRSVSFQDLDIKFIHDYEDYLKTKLGNGINTVHKDMKYIRQLFNDAIRQGIIDANLNPFRQYQIKLEKTQREYLTETELKQLIILELTPYSRLDLHRDMFVFCAYVGGLRVSDILKLQRSNFDGAHIDFTIKKTKRQLSIKLPNRALTIIEKWKTSPNASERFLFPIFADSIDLDNPIELDKRISGATAYINKNLKILAKKAGITKKLSFHISRHTWATRALRKGISIDKVSKLMGHAAIRETQIYAKIVNEELDKAMDVFND